MRVLVLNAGSSTLKVRLIEVARAAARPLAAGLFHDLREVPRALFDQAQAVGDRVVHGGSRFHAPVAIDADILGAIDALTELAPLHNPHSVAVIKQARARLPAVPMVAVFDTAFHRTLPDHAARYAIQEELAEKHHIRRYGFHGIAHASMLEAYARAVGKPRTAATIITLQLGNGCSATAIARGCSVDTSMGFTPLEGLMMGTRAGDLDPALVGYLARRERVAVDQVEHWLNEASRDCSACPASRTTCVRCSRARASARARAEMFCYRVRKYIGAYLAVLEGAEAVIFGGGIGEHASIIRARICAGLAWCGLRLDPDRNDAATAVLPGEVAEISLSGAPLKAYVAGVDEETQIAIATAQLIETRNSDASL
ncbi:MAG: acetate/propionate family kinase [Planctomycetota bacterium]